MVDARTYTCPSCGAPVHEHARDCRHCAAPIATVRCASCYHMSVAEAVHCAGCGRELGLEPVGKAAELGCPNCETPLLAFDEGGASVFDCSRCGGQFIEHAAFRELLDRRDRPTLAPPPSQKPFEASGPVRYVPCPVCRSLMNRKNFGITSGVVIDVCRKHGSWFDTGELPRVLAFVEAGGLAIERQRKADEAAQARKKAVAEATPSTLGLESVDRSPTLELGQKLGSFLIEMLLR